MSIFIQEVLRVLTFVWEAILHIWPLLLITIPLSIFIREMGIANKIHRVIGKRIGVSILIATLIGAISPFCSCSVIPVIAALLIAGVPLAPVMSFWLASPSMDPEIFFLSVASIGWDLAIARLVVTFIMSVAGGLITHWVMKRWDPSIPVLKRQQNPDCDESSGCGCADEIPRWKRMVMEGLKAIVFVFKYLLIAFTLEALIKFYLPTDVVQVIFTGKDYLSILIATLVSVPLYTTNISALGMIGGLMAKGLGDGAALAFLVGGATTTIPAMSAVFRLVHRRIFLIYLGVTMVFTILSGFLFELMF